MTNEEAIYVLKNTAWLGSDKDREATEEAVNMAIEALKAQTGWIPVSERLPREKERVLTFDNIGNIDFGQYDKGQWYWEAEACADYWARNDGVIAWMPLPEPYKGGDSE